MVLGTLAAAPGIARAYDEVVTLGFEVGYAAVLTDVDLPRHGPELGVVSSIGLGDMFSLRGRFAYAVHPGSEALHVGMLGVEVYYLLDIVQLVPFFGIGLDAIATLYDGTFGADPAVHAIIGLDYLLNRRVILGIDIRPYWLPLSLNDNGVDPVYLTINVRVSIRFERY